MSATIGTTGATMPRPRSYKTLSSGLAEPVVGKAVTTCASPHESPHTASSSSSDVWATLQVVNAEVKAFSAAFAPALAQLHAAVRKIESSIICEMVAAKDGKISCLTERTLDRIDYLLWGANTSDLLNELLKVEGELSASGTKETTEEANILHDLRDDLTQRRDKAGLNDDNALEAFAVIRRCDYGWDVPIAPTKAMLLECIEEQLPRKNFVQESIRDAALVVVDMYYKHFHI